MTRYAADSTNHTDQDSRSEPSASQETLGWEGHVNVPKSPVWNNLLVNWPELRTGLAFSMVFVVGAMVGGSLALLFGCNRRNTDN
ncbi:hypothetical protein [Candidatus Nitronereus thalassa]|uniref:Uncharacterized protein n=1 Tax=Candidatus Nitronereus thalassa TaxID=3020898 RepID=A0ABU3K5T2_9BACT|nr:hypothetical protein [Candidatus Nitronereus thalassa]MDT7041777.1 hypothetical protein [Candidatus Nitronereus thalassa]